MYITNKIYQDVIKKTINNSFEQLKNKTFFITGASGLVGSFLVDTLMFLNTNYNYNIRIYAVFSSETSYNARYPSYVNKELFIPIFHDITKSFDKNYGNIDYIIHAASNTHPKLYAQQPVETIELNILGTLNVLKLANYNKNSRTIFLSTLEVYGEDKNIKMFKEENIGVIDFNISRACYPSSKRLCETLCHSFIQEYLTDICIARLGYIYGPTVKLNSSKADVQFLVNALNHESIVLKSAGLQQRSYCFVGDVVNALLTILLKGKTGEAYNISSKNGSIMLKDYAETLAKIAKVNIKFDKAGEVERKGGSKVTNSTLDSTKLESLGWVSLFSFKEGLSSTFTIKRKLTW